MYFRYFWEEEKNIGKRTSLRGCDFQNHMKESDTEMNQEIRAGDRYILHSSNGVDYIIEIVSVNPLRPADMLYAADVRSENRGGYHAVDVEFFGNDFFETNKWKLEKVEV